MSRQRDTDRLVESWLAEGPSRLPDRVIDNIVTHIEQNQQRGPFWRPGRQQMNRMMLAVGGVAAAILLVIVGAVAFAGLGANRPGFGSQPTPTPTLAPTTAPTSSPVPSAAQLNVGESSIGPGRYVTEFQGFHYTFSVPAGTWTANVKFDARIVARDDGDVFAGLFVVGDVRDLFADACQWQGAPLVPGPTVADLAAALTTVDGFEASDATEVTIAGYDGQHVRLTVPEDTDMAACDNGQYHGMGGFYAYEPGRVQDIWVLDLDGTRSVLFTIWDANAPIAVQDEVAGLASSLEIEAAAP